MNLMKTQKSRLLSEQVKQIVEKPKNKEIADHILVKMGRLLAKKQSLSSEQPTLVYQDRIWLGNYLYASDKNFLLSNNIRTVISCLDLSLSSYLPEVEYLKFSLNDSADSRFEEMTDEFNSSLQRTKGNVYVHCFSGKSRSVAFLLGFIMSRERIRFQAAFEKLKFSYNLASPNQYFVETLKKMEEKWMHLKQIQSEDLLSQEIPKQVDPVSQGLLIELEPNQSLRQEKSPQNNLDLLNVHQEPYSPNKEVIQYQTNEEISPSKQQKSLIDEEDFGEVKIEESLINKKQEFGLAEETNLLKIQGENPPVSVSEQSTTIELKEDDLTQQPIFEGESHQREQKIEEKGQDLIDLSKQTEMTLESQAKVQIQQQKKEQISHPPLQKEEEMNQHPDFTQKKKKNKKKKR